jgi:CheY-like chemotaxis protein
MPIIDGVAATQKLRAKYNDLPPIVGLSAIAFEGDREKYMELGMDDYLRKPVSKNDFKRCFESACCVFFK